MTITPSQIIIACWVIYVLYWNVSALSAKPVAERPSWTGTMWHRLPTLIGAVLMFLDRLPYPLEVRLTPDGRGAGYIGAAICVLGLLVSIWSRRTLAGNWSAAVVFKEGHELVERGPYRYVRHPIYTGLLLMCLGSAIPAGCVRSWLGLVLVFAGFWIKLRQEEVLMNRHFPNEYPSYQTRVKALIPFVF